MEYEIYLNSREFEIVAKDFNFEKYYCGFYNAEARLGLTREAWVASGRFWIPLYLHDVGMLEPDYLIEQAKNIVTPEPMFSIFDKENLTFAEMVNEIWLRRKEIVRVTPGDDNPYE
jgi:hypothetical protein